MAKKHGIKTIMGHTIPRPHATIWVWVRLAQYLILPFFGGLLALDLLFYFIFKYGLDSCYGVLCLLE